MLIFKIQAKSILIIIINLRSFCLCITESIDLKDAGIKKRNVSIAPNLIFYSYEYKNSNITIARKALLLILLLLQ